MKLIQLTYIDIGKLSACAMDRTENCDVIGVLTRVFEVLELALFYVSRYD